MKNSENNHEFNQARLGILQASFAAVLEQKDLFSNIVDFFPYGIEVFAKDGTTVMINRVFLNEFDIPDRDMVIGKYNIFTDPEIEKAGLTDIVKSLFEGKRKTLTKTDIKVPLKAISEVYQTGDSDVVAIYQDATGFPIFDEAGDVSHVVIMFITRRIYRGKVSIAKAAEYMENNWDKEYDLSETAKAAGLSRQSCRAEIFPSRVFPISLTRRIYPPMRLKPPSICQNSELSKATARAALCLKQPLPHSRRRAMARPPAKPPS
jgi:hypothetical protein